MKTVFVYVPDDIYETVRRLAFEMRISQSELLRRALMMWLQNQQKRLTSEVE